MNSSCQDKLAYKTKEEAEGAKVTAQYNHDSDNLKTYQCPKCNLWHITSTYDQ